ncbi:protease [Staphylococcus pseudintermedius]|uniref:protease n=1 Tax=Staphylococcus pseudintermedius TaxID=283734 RepID=UPI003F9A66AF
MKKLMMINTSHHQFGYDEKPTGLVLGELVHFYDAFNREGYTMNIYINGSDTPIDSVSLNKLMLDRATKTYYEGAHFMALLKKMRNLLLTQIQKCMKIMQVLCVIHLQFSYRSDTIIL